jgi:hypothetical protein
MSEDRRSGASPGDGAIDAAWRRASTEEPSARVDAAILEAARAATSGTAQSGPVLQSKRHWAHWRPLAAAAAVAALALLLVPRAEREDVMLDSPTRAPLTEAAPPAAQTAPAETSASARQAASAEESALSDAIPAAKMPQGAPQSTAEPVLLEAMPVEDEVRAEGAAPGPAMAPSRGVATTVTDVPAGSIAPQQWVDRIASLHAAGDLAGAAASLQEFRRAYPDAADQLPPALRAWAAGVPQEP